MNMPALPGANLLDRVITIVAPDVGLRRARARAMLALSGGYTGARGDNRALKAWYAKMGSPDSDSVGDLPTLRQRSSDLRRNTPIATGALSTITGSVVGSGIRPRPRIDRELLGLSEEEATKWETQAARLWAWWAETTACDAAGRIDFYAMQALVQMSSLERGDIIAVRRFKRGAGGRRRPIGLALQLLEADYLCNPDFRPDTARMVQGIEFDEFGEPQRFWFASRHPGDRMFGGPITWSSVPAVSEESGERLVLHVMDQLRPMQSRGVPILAPVIEQLKQLGRYTDAELMAAVLSSFLTVFVKQENPTNPTGLAAPDADPTAADPGEYRLGQGAIIDLAAGESIETVDPKRPNDRFEPFVLAVLRQIGVALELPFEILIKHFSSSYSASKAAMVEAWRMYMRRRRSLTLAFNMPVYDWLIAEAVAAGILSAPGFFDDELTRRAWTRAMWTGDAPGQIDEEAAVNAADQRIRTGLSTLEEETAKLTGGDWEQNHPQQVKERKARVAGGLDEEPVAERVVTESNVETRNPDGSKVTPSNTPGRDETPSSTRRGRPQAASEAPSRLRRECLEALNT